MNEDKEFFTVDICGRKVSLPVLTLDGGVKIAFFNLHGKVGLTEYCAQMLAGKLRKYEADVLLTAESKGLQLTHCVARNLGHDFYAVARKTKKLYLNGGIEAGVRSITSKEQTLYLSRSDAELLKGKRVGIVDDVVSTGGSLEGLELIVEKAGGTVAFRAAVLAEGEAKNRKDLVYLSHIPLL